jgi:PKD repeat protein
VDSLNRSSTFNTPSKRIWSFGDLTDVVNTDSVSVLYKYKEKGTYNVWLKIIDQHGCTDSVNNTIEIHDRYYVIEAKGFRRGYFPAEEVRQQQIKV